MTHQADIDPGSVKRVPVSDRPASGYPLWALSAAQDYLTSRDFRTLDKWPDQAWLDRVLPLAHLLTTVVEVAKS